MSATRRFPAIRMATAIVAGALAFALAPPAARADDNMLRGPHPFLKDNELSAHVQVVAGFGRTPGGSKIAADYGYHLYRPLWLDLQLNVQRAPCHSPSGASTCDQPSGSIFETMAGAKMKFATPIPVVPYLKGAVGLAFAFPDGARNGMGPAVRVGGGANYFFFDWLGLGVEFAYSLGHLSTGDSTYAEFDVGGGIEFQF
jgi:hypothetical protein